MAPGGLLPLPCTVGGSGFPAGRRRLLLIGLVFFTVFTLYRYSNSEASTFSAVANSSWRPDLAGLIKPPSALRPGGLANTGSRYSNPKNLRIKPPAKHLLPVYHFTSIPSSSGDPWPDRPEIAQVYFSPTRAHKDPPIPEWPLPLELADADDVLRRPTIAPVPYEDIYKGVNKIAGMGKPSRNPKRVQGSPDGESAEDRSERLQRKQWVERAIRHAWEGYK